MKLNPCPRLSEMTTLHLGGTALMEIIVEKVEECFLLAEKINEIGGSSYYFGKGSNILAHDGIVPLTIIKVAPFNPPEIIESVNGTFVVKVGAGIRISGLLQFCHKNSLTGLEGLCGIPGTVGGAVTMNAGSFGVEICDFLLGVDVWTGREIKYYKINELLPEYRSLTIPGEIVKPLVLNAYFTLTNAQNNDIFNRMTLNFFEKKFKQPIDSWTAGCVFKNPPDAPPAGFLLDKSGFKGKKIGGVSFSTKHANFMVNEGTGTASEAFELLNLAKEVVGLKFGVPLQEEVRIIPENIS